MNKEKIEKFIDKRYCNKADLEKVKYCGCECCSSLLKTEFITEWIDEGEGHLYVLNKEENAKVIKEGFTAKCPFCGDDNIIPLTNEYEESKSLFRELLVFENKESEEKIYIKEYIPEQKNNDIKIKIIKGTNQIGGCITEIQSNQAKIIIDFGEDLDDRTQKSKKEVPQIEGLTYGKPKYDAVFITHSHQDHIGLIDCILPEIPVYVEEKSQKIYELTCAFTGKKCRENIKSVVWDEWYKEYVDIPVKDMIIKYYKIDHSAYNSAMILVECGGKRILNTGDFRNHGYKGNAFIPTLKEIKSIKRKCTTDNYCLPKEKKQINCLITEGTIFDRENVKCITEQELSYEAIEIFKKYKQVFILQSSTNIDRITSFFKASIRTGKKFIEDVFTANITLEIGKNIPNPEFDNNKVSVWEPSVYKYSKSNEFKEKYIKPLEKYKHVENVYGDYAMLVKTSMYNDIKMLYDKGKIKKACLVYSMWHGYLEKKEMREFIEKIKALGIDFIELHTSGHADLYALKIVEKILKPQKVIAIHTKEKEKAKKIFNNAIMLEDNVEIKI